jgi:dTDP-L-rhamnose 4-epimerase
MRKIAISGGCGFIGSHLVEKLLTKNWEPVILDNLCQQVHGKGMIIPQELLNQCRFIKGDVRNAAAWEKTLEGVKAVIHLAAETGLGQSMYRNEHFTSVNITGTAVLLDYLMKNPGKVEKVILASSRAVYGEGDYSCPVCGVVRPRPRKIEDLKSRKWEVACRSCGGAIVPVGTSETSSTKPLSTYGITKLTQEQLVEVGCRILGIGSVSLRYQNVYGPRQSLSNPYTGILPIFSTRIRNRLPIHIYEDGQMSRDFIYVSDVVEATLLALAQKELYGEVFNVGTGKRTTVLEVAHILANTFDSDEPFKFDHYYRIGDIRHCFASITKIRKQLGFVPQCSVEKGLTLLAEWVIKQPDVQDNSDRAFDELQRYKIYK